MSKYDQKYLELGFAFASSSEKEPLSMCLVCAKIPSMEAMKPSKLTRHFLSQQRNLVRKPLAYSKKPLKEIENLRNEMLKVTMTNKALFNTLYLIAFVLSKTKKH